MNLDPRDPLTIYPGLSYSIRRVIINDEVVLEIPYLTDEQQAALQEHLRLIAELDRIE